MRENRLAYIALFFTTLFWAGNAVAGKLAVGHISPMVLTLLRWSMAFTIMLAIAGPQAWRERRQILPHIPILIVYGVVGFAFFNVTLYGALNYTSAINVMIEQSAVPAVIFIANFLLFRIRVHIGQIIGFLLSLIGVAVVASNGSLARLAALDINFGDALMGLSILCYAAYSVGLRFKPDIHWKPMMLVMAFGALLTSIPFAIWEMNGPNAVWPDRQGWLVSFYTAVFPAIISQVLYIRGVMLIGANRAGLFINLVPVIGTLLAIIILGEVFHVYHAIAMALVIGGIALAENSGRRAKAREQSA